MNQAKSLMPNESLRNARLSHGWTRAELAQKTGCHTKLIRLWERGLIAPSPPYVKKLCQALGKDARTLGLLPDEPQIAHAPKDAAIAQEGTNAEERQTIFDPAIPLLPDKPLVGREKVMIAIKQQLRGRGNVALTALNG